jgi:glycosyltransferase involved in cell wall biosynthesis
VIGQGPELQNMKKIAKDIKIENQVVFLNHLPYNQVLTIFKEARCLILGSIPNPTWQEQFGYVLAESICAGTPVISTFSGAIPEVVGKAGLLVSPAHPIELSKALLQMDNVDVYKNLKKACNTEAERFSTQLYVQKVSDVYRQLTVI